MVRNPFLKTVYKPLLQTSHNKKNGKTWRMHVTLLTKQIAR